jgi:hypothetical protein
MTIGEFIEALEALPPDAFIEFDCGGVPLGFASWRGAYAEATLPPENLSWKPTVGDTLDSARHAISGEVFEGWKGGDYTFDENTALWADDEGVYRRRCIVGIEPKSTLSDTYVIKTFTIPWEYR